MHHPENFGIGVCLLYPVNQKIISAKTTFVRPFDSAFFMNNGFTMAKTILYALFLSIIVVIG